MPDLTALWEILPRLLPLLVILAFSIGGLWAADWILLRRQPNIGNERRAPRQLLMLGLTGLALVLVLLALPVTEATRGQLLSLLGVLLTAIIALSSTTFVANMMAGFMLRLVRNFRSGDFIRVGEHFGRVTERGLFHTELQTEDRDLTTLPNLYLIAHAVTVVRASGTIISCELTLGYDVAHDVIRPLLVEAAADTGLQEPFVRVLELGDFAVTYRVSGFLEDVKGLLSKRSEIRLRVMDTLHEAGIEIASPALRIERHISKRDLIVPEPSIEPAGGSMEDGGTAALVFDKAERAETIESLRERREALAQEIRDLESGKKPSRAESREAWERDIAARKDQLKAMDENITRMEAAAD